ncbi:TPA: GNAT family N-acetyltransferase [Legionella pneumophila]|uniref:GNAT family N-acetyltransferase n=1 Tax=Legionella pneumophila TaxID=446 RepID=UPI001374AB9C|nr:GNAT family N-acetyltransferase [Legionella pneumophila]HAT9703083.1 GNAT family N-acetyltransferase [Legionella pneumophila subsp. pneumophila]MDI0469824.1 GNAT family N-acetyltransferase [Legionella pneumophila]HAT8742752.1 GNAT family N-acetyltransferase [Legionella pneumophila]HAU1444118.1 GNAT family N-acetyltransferase [Legionella pneumophila]HBI2978869.1 GNAT family N-acetyltransferase [Legionella pneumophila]
MHIIKTSRLILRPWHEQDSKPFFEINHDEKVLEFLSGSMSEEQINEFMRHQNAQLETRHYMLWAVELQNTDELIGFIGLNYFDKPAHFSPAVEIGWRLGSQYWGYGYATEGALASLDYGFNQLKPNEIVAFTVPDNLRSRKVMEKIGMTHDINGSFAHPKLPLNHRLSNHVLYRIKREQ